MVTRGFLSLFMPFKSWAARKKSSRSDMDSEIRERQLRICKAWANSTRLHLLGLLGRREWPVSQVRAKIGISKANLSQQLAVLKCAGIVRTRREGRMIYCSRSKEGRAGRIKALFCKAG
jgi:DNA-binding transcriptional ArsR family regulator